MLTRITLGLALMSTTLSSVAALATDVKPGDYRLVVATVLGELPINLKLEKKGEQWVAAYINGPERMQAEVTQVAGNAITAEFPSYGSKLDAKVDDAGNVTGNLIFSRASGAVEVPFTGKAGVSYRFFPDAAKQYAAIGGRWMLTLPTPDGKTRPGIGEFTQTKNTIHGAVMYTNADTRWLAGEVRGNELYMSTFEMVARPRCGAPRCSPTAH